MSDSGGDILLASSGLSKSYPGVAALSDVGLEVRRGEVHALVGENGAGKSTLAGILCGLIVPDAGSMRLMGRPYAPATRLDAERRGVRMVMQELNLIDNLTVAESIFFDQMPRRLGWIDYRRMNAEAARLMGEVALSDVAPDCPVRDLGVGRRQMVEIAAGLSRRCDLLILDEPTAALTDAEAERLFAQIQRLRREGTGLIYISHRLEEIRRIADRVTVLRDGRHVATAPAAEADPGQIIRWMVGRDLGDSAGPVAPPGGEPALRVRRLCRGRAVRDVSFEVRRGEILGFAGLMGSGRTETMRAVFGADRPDSGEVYVGPSDRPARIRSPRDAVRLGIALLTEDRKGQGLLLSQPVRVNVTLAALCGLAGACGWVRADREQAAVDRLVRALSIRCRSPEQLAGQLSGGNQQKVVIARWLLRDCDVLIFDEPTRGIDVGAKFEIYRLLADLTARGKAIIMVSSDLKELLAVCHRVAVMSAGRITGVFERARWSPQAILAAALSGYAGARGQGADS